VTTETGRTAVASRPSAAEAAENQPDGPGDRTARTKWTSGRRDAGIVLLIATISFVATLLATMRWGIGLTPDSFVYLDGARSLAHGHGYVSDGQAITAFAPGYSAVLSLAEHVNISVSSFARVLAGLSFAVTVVLGYVLLRRHIRSRKITIAATVAIGCSGALLQTYREALSEHLFIIVVILFVLVAEDVLRRPRALVPSAMLVALTWAAFYLRYAGLIFIPLAALFALIALWRTSKRRALLQPAIMLLAGVALPALWMRRNTNLGTGALGSRQDAAVGPFTNVARTSRELSTWLATSSTPAMLRLLVFLAFSTVAAIVIVAVLQKRLTVPDDTREIVPAALVASVYLIYLTATASLVAFAPINGRFMAPAFVPAVVVGAWAFERIRPQATPPVRRWINAVAVAWLLVSVLWFAGTVVTSARSGAGGYASARWHDSKLMEDVRKLDSSVPAYTNDSVAIELFTGRVVPLSVAKTFLGSNEETGDLPSFVHEVECAGHAELIWFLPNGRPRLYSPDQLAQHVQLKARIRRSDGVIYDVTPAPGSKPRNCH
jgi:hypothetical protein